MGVGASIPSMFRSFSVGFDGVVFQKFGWCSKTLLQNPHGSMGWCSKKLSQNSRWGGVPKVGVVFQKVVPESPLCILLLRLSTNSAETSAV